MRTTSQALLSTASLEEEATLLAFAQHTRYASVWNKAPSVGLPKGHAPSRHNNSAGAEAAFVVNGEILSEGHSLLCE